MISHPFRIAAITGLLLTLVIYPFLPGSYDAGAVALSTMTQAFGGVGSVLLAPIGVVWMGYEAWGWVRRRRGQPHGMAGHRFAAAALGGATLMALVVAGAATAIVGISLGLATGVLWLGAVRAFLPRVAEMRGVPSQGFNPAPLYLAIIPVSVLAFQIAAAAPLTGFSQARAIASADELIRGIEAYRARHGRYPVNLEASWPDFRPRVVGIALYRYARSGDAYNLFFEQPRFLFDRPGTQEYVVFNPLGEHAVVAHAAHILEGNPAQLEATPGWYAVVDAAVPRWKRFWFD